MLLRRSLLLTALWVEAVQCQRAVRYRVTTPRAPLRSRGGGSDLAGQWRHRRNHSAPAVTALMVTAGRRCPRSNDIVAVLSTAAARPPDQIAFGAPTAPHSGTCLRYPNAALREESLVTAQAVRTIQPSFGINVRDSTELTSDERTLLLRADMHGVAPIETWTVNGTNKQLAYSTHGVYRYFGKFPPPIARRLLDTYCAHGDLAIDPTSGCGTTAVEAILAGQHAIASDVSPLSTLLGRVKTTWVDKTAVLSILQETALNAARRKPTDFNFTPVGLRNPGHWFLPETQRSLQAIRESIALVPDKAVRELLLVSLLAIVRRVSRATTQQGRLFLDAQTAVHDALPFYRARAEKVAEAVASLPRTHDVQIQERDLLDCPTDFDGLGAALAIVHPPYFNAYKYSSVNSLELAWLGVDQASIRKREIRESFKIGKPERLNLYIEDMRIALTNASLSLRPGGTVALMIGDTVMGGEHIRVVRPLLQSVDPSLTVEKVVIRVPRYTEATWAASQRRHTVALGARISDFIVILRKE